MKKRLVSLLLAFSMMLTFLPVGAVSAFAAETKNPTSGTTGKNGSITWTLSGGTLTFKGTGSMTNYKSNAWWLGSSSSKDPAPWLWAKDQITEIKIAEGITTIGSYAFEGCSQVETITLPWICTGGIGNAAFLNCSNLKKVFLQYDANQKFNFGDNAFKGCSSELKIYFEVQRWGLRLYNRLGMGKISGYQVPASTWSGHYGEQVIRYDGQDPIPLCYLCGIYFNASGGVFRDTGETEKMLPEYVYRTENMTAEQVASVGTPFKQDSVFLGWSLDRDGTAENLVDPTNIPPDPTDTHNGNQTYFGGAEDCLYLYAVYVPGTGVTVKDGTITKVVDEKGNNITEDISEPTVDPADKTKLTYIVPAGAKVTVKANDAPQGMKFNMWTFSVASMNGDYENAIYNDTMEFTVPEGGVSVDAMYQGEDIDDGPSIIGDIAIGATVVAGGAVLGYQAYQLGAGFLGDLWGLPYFPSNRSALAMMLWEDAGEPMPESDILYPDVGWEEQDMDLQHAARWAMEHELIPDKNDKDADLTPEEVKFFPDDPVSKYSVLKAWKKAQDLKKNAAQ